MSEKMYRIEREVPLVHEADVVVLGGGPGGLGAAIAAARSGAKTLLVEQYGVLGGMAAVGEVHPFMGNHADGVCLDKPVYVDWVKKMRGYLPADAGGCNEGDWDEVRGSYPRMISKDVAALAAEELCLEAGVELLYHHSVADVVVEAGAIEAVVLVSKSGWTAAKGAMYIDCTGDGDVAARAGCAFEEGGPTGHSQPMTLCFKLSGVEKERMPARAEINALYRAAKERGELECLRENVLYFYWYDEDVVHFNTTRVIHRRGSSGADLSAAEIEGRKQLRQYLSFLRKEVRGFERARIHSVGHQIGVRESRRVLGLAYLEREAFTRHAKFEDAIARVRYSIDIHNPDGENTEIERMPEGEWYEIPYGCIVPKDISNLLMGGRPISVDHAIHSSMRVMPPACSVGQAAGMAAAMACKAGRRPGELDGREVRGALRAFGAFL